MKDSRHTTFILITVFFTGPFEYGDCWDFQTTKVDAKLAQVNVRQ
jgi:hypothetical protein